MIPKYEILLFLSAICLYSVYSEIIIPKIRTCSPCPNVLFPRALDAFALMHNLNNIKFYMCTVHIPASCFSVHPGASLSKSYLKSAIFNSHSCPLIWMYQWRTIHTFHAMWARPAGCMNHELWCTVCITSGFWPRVRARALRAPILLSSLPGPTGRCAPPAHRSFAASYLPRQSLSSGPHSGRQGHLSFHWSKLHPTVLHSIYWATLHPPVLRCTLMSYTAP